MKTRTVSQITKDTLSCRNNDLPQIISLKTIQTHTIPFHAHPNRQLWLQPQIKSKENKTDETLCISTTK